MRPGDEVEAEGLWGCVTKNGKPSFFIYDQIAGHMSQCLVAEDLLPQALAACQRRVEISGTVLEAGHIQVTRIHPFPCPREIPSLAAMRLLLEP